MRLLLSTTIVALVFLGLLIVFQNPALATDGAVQLTFEPGADGMPDFSPDGTQIVFQSSRTGKFQLYIMPATGGPATRLLEDTTYCARPAWSPDGAYITYETNRKPDTTLLCHYPICDIYIIPAGGGTPTQITTYDQYDERPDWSPDCNQIVFASDRPGEGSLNSLLSDSFGDPANLWVIPVTGEPAVQLTFEVGYENDPVWSPDGSTIAFMADYSGSWDIYTMPATGGPATQLTTDPDQDDTPEWSPSGDYIAWRTRRLGNSDIWVMSKTGEDKAPITTDPSGDWGPSWSPDGTKIAFYSIRTGDYEIFVIDVPTAGIREGEGTTWGGIKARFEPDEEESE